MEVLERSSYKIEWEMGKDREFGQCSNLTRKTGGKTEISTFNDVCRHKFLVQHGIMVN